MTEIDHFPTPSELADRPTDLDKPLIYTSPVREQKKIPCYNQECDKQVSPNEAVWYNMGISHYSKQKGVSYIQVHVSPFCCGEACAREFIHKRIDQHANLPHGEYDEVLLNPLGEHSSSLVEANARYTPLGRGWDTLPIVDGITGLPLGDDIYVPHLDRCSNQDPQRGTEGYHVSTGELGTATLSDCIKLCHLLVDEILTPSAAYRKEISS